MYILQRKSPFRLQISLSAFFAKLLKFSIENLKNGLCKWCKSAIKHKFRLNFDTFLWKTSSSNITSDDKNDKQILKFIKTCASGLTFAQNFYLQKNSIFGIKSASLRKISLFAVNDLLFLPF